MAWRNSLSYVSPLEEKFEFQLKAFGITGAQREYQFDPARRWRFDFAWPEKKVAVEIEGGIWVGGSHVRGVRYESDCEKYNTAMMQGWRPFRFTARPIHDGVAVDLIKKVLDLS